MTLLACEKGNLEIKVLDLIKIQGIMAALVKEFALVKKTKTTVWCSALVPYQKFRLEIW